MAAIRNIPSVYLKSARTLHLSPWQTIVPGAAAGDPAGSRRRLAHRLHRHAARRAAGGDVRLENGLGFLIVNAMALLQTEEMITIAMMLFVFAAAANALLLWMEHRMHRRAG